MWKAWRKLLFVDASAIVRVGRIRPLTPEDAPPLRPELVPSRELPAHALSLAPFWPFLTRLFFATGKPARTILALTVTRVAIASSAPVILHSLLQQLTAANATSSPPWQMFALALMLGVASMSGALLTQHAFFAELQIRTRIVNTLNQRVVVHALRLRRSARASMQTGDLINHLGSDTDALAEAGFFLPETLHALLTMVVAFSALIVLSRLGRVGSRGRAGCAVAARAAARGALSPARRADHEHSRQRTTLMSQIVHGIRVVKYLAWEPSVHAEVQCVRKHEIRTRIGIVGSDVLSSAIFVSTATLVAFTGFGTFVLARRHAQAPLVFACLALFSMLEEPFGLIVTYSRAHLSTRTSRAAAGRVFLRAGTRPGCAKSSSPATKRIALQASELAVQYRGCTQPRARGWRRSTIRAGESVAIVGPVGAGKSTLLRVLGGIQLPVHGAVEHAG